MYAIDRQAIVKAVLKTGNVAACSFSNPAYIPSDVNTYAQNVALAKSLLQQANWNSIKGAPMEIVTYYNDTGESECARRHSAGTGTGRHLGHDQVNRQCYVWPDIRQQ